ncbi:MAG: right-handed parallel beta-helix repeat-containing protein, partial [Acidobacteria bacterium]|nr:right-handed parallel beta-helix repeat-containing protein [Acidobacteriota bacterium]
GVLVDSSSLDSSTHLSYVTVAEGGQDDAALYIAGSSPVIDNLTISGSQQYGLILWEAAPTITTATITGTGSAPILASANCRLKNLSGFIFDPNTWADYSGGTITGESETLPAFSVPYHVTGWIEVYQDLTTAASLTLSPGTRLEFAPATGLNVGTWADASQGILISAGTESSPVVLSGIDGATWDSVNFLDGSVDGSTRLDHTNIALAGAGSNRAVYVGSCSPIFYNCRIEASPAHGLWAESSPGLQVTGTVFEGSGSYPVSIDIMTSLAEFTGNIFLNNNPDSLEQRGGDVTSDTRIAYTEQPYVLNGAISIHGTAEMAATLTVDPGVVLKQNTTGGITVGLPTGEKGRLVAEGTALQPITFTTNLTPAPGAWHGLEAYTASPASSLKQVTIEFAGNANERSMDLIGGAVTLDTVTIRQGLGTAIAVLEPGASATLTDCTLDTFTAHAVELAAGSAFAMTGGSIAAAGTYGVTIDAASPTFSGVTITQCGTAPIRANTSSRLKNIGSLTLDSGAQIEYESGRLQGEDEAFPGVPIVLSGSLQVANDTSTATTLTIAGGANLIFPSGSALTIGLQTGEKGTLICNGSAGAPIILDGTSQTAGSWIGLELYPSSGASSAAFTTVTHAGQTNNRSILIDNASPALSSSTISSGTGIGMYITGGAPSITSTLFQNLTSYPISLDIASAATLASNTFSGCNPDAIQLRGGTLTADHRITNAGGAYYINGSIEVRGTTLSPATLTIDPGVSLAFSSGSKLLVGGASWSQPGALIAVGTVDQPIVLTGQTQARGGWGGLEFRDGTIDATTHLAFCQIEYGGSPGISITTSSPLLEDSSIRQSSGAAVSASTSSARLTRATIDANGAEGITLGGVGTFTIESSTITGNTWGINSSGTLLLTGSTLSSNSLGGVRMSSGTCTITGCTVSSTPTGLYLDAGSAAVTNSTIANCTGYPITFDGDASITGSALLTFVTNGQSAIEHRGGTIATSQTLPALGLPYHVKAALSVTGSTQSAVLSVDPGVVLEFAAATELGVWAQGALRSLGTTESPVTLHALGSTSPGAWTGIRVGENADATQTELSNLVVEHAVVGIEIDAAPPLTVRTTRIALSNTGMFVFGMTSIGMFGISVDGASVTAIKLSDSTATMQDCTASGAGGDAVSVTRCSLTASNCALSNSVTGIRLTSSPAVLTGVSVSDMSGTAIALDSQSGLAGTTGLTLSGNASNTIEHKGGTGASHHIAYVGYPYVVQDDIAVTGPVTIEAGVEMRFEQWRKIYGSTVTAVGTAAQTILLTASSATPTPGYWPGVETATGGGASEFEYVTIEYAVNGLFAGDTVTLRNCQIRSGSYNGLTITGGQASVVSDAVVSGNAGDGVALTSSAGATLTACTISSNGGDGLDAGAAGLVDAENCSITLNTGSGVRLHGTGSTTLRSSTISNNSANGVVVTGGTNELTACTIAGNGQAGLVLNAGISTIRRCSITNNPGLGIDIDRDGGSSPTGTTIQHSAISGNLQGGAVYGTTGSLIDTRYNYWGDSTGPSGVGPGGGDSVGSVYLVYFPWLESVDVPEIEITEGWASNLVVPARQSMASFWATSSVKADWTFQIRDAQDTLVYDTTGTGKVFLERWNCLDEQAQSLAPGPYTWRLAAVQSDNPALAAAPIAGRIEVKAGIPTAELLAPVEQNDAPGLFDVLGTAGDSPTSWTLRGGAGEGWLLNTSVPDMTVLASGTTEEINAILTTADLRTQTDGRYLFVLTATNANGTTEQRITVNRGRLTVAPNPFSPNGDEVDDTVSFTGTFDDATSWDLSIADPTGSVVRTFTGSSGTLNAVWDGRDQSGELLPDNRYNFDLQIHDGEALAQEIAGLVVAWSTPPTVTVTSPLEGTVISNLLGNQVQDLRGSIILPFDMPYTWTLDPWGTTGEETTSMIDHSFGPWDSTDSSNGPFTVRLTATTYLGDFYDEVTVQIGHFEITNSAAAGIFNPMLGESAPLTISVGFATDVSVDVLTVANTNKSEVPTVI